MHPRRFALPLLAGSLSLLLSACSEPEAPEAPPPAAVSVYEVKEEAVSPRREFVARTEAYAEAGLVARLEATVEEILFKEGALVESGQLLVKLERTTAAASAEESRAELSAAKDELTSAKRNLDRGEEVAKKGFLSASDLDKLRDRYNEARARVKSAEANLEKTDINLAYTEIRAPFDGRIGRINSDVGNVVNPSSGPIAEILAVDPIYVNFKVNEGEFLEHQKREQARGPDAEPLFDLRLKLTDGDIYGETGRLDYTDPRVDPGTGTVNVRAVFANPERLLLPGMYVTLVVEGKSEEQHVLVPQVAVQENQEGKFVLIVDAENQVKQRLVKLGERRGPLWIVRQGLDDGDQVIVEGLQKVKPGAEVSPVPKTLDPETGALSDLTVE